MSVGEGFRAYLGDILSPLGPLSIKRVFGFDGLKAGNVLLGFVIDERIFLRTDEAERERYASEGGKPFSFTTSNGEHIVTSYYSIPERLYDEPDELVQWARKAYAAALKAPSAKARRARNERMAEKAKVRSPSDGPLRTSTTKKKPPKRGITTE